MAVPLVGLKVVQLAAPLALLMAAPMAQLTAAQMAAWLVGLKVVL